MKRVYLDNAATTPIDPAVLDAMSPYMMELHGNPSSAHYFGRQAKAGVVKTRKLVATALNCSPGEIIFTSGGTEADNMAITCSVRDLGVTHIITSSIEHHAVGHTVEFLTASDDMRMSLVKLDENGHVDMAHLEELLQTTDTTLVSLMHANNEIGTLLDLDRVSKLCRSYNAYFHSDTVQTMCHYPMDLETLDIDFITASAHKFHGPKGVGFLYINKKLNLNSLIFGGSQERNLRGGTENVYGIVGLGKAFELAHEDMAGHQRHVQGLKTYMMESLKEMLPEVDFHGETDPKRSLYTVLNVCFPKTPNSSMLLFSLDLNGVACSGGSACSSGSDKGSHVLAGINAPADRPNARFSFSRFTTKEDIDFALDVIRNIFVEECQPQ